MDDIGFWEGIVRDLGGRGQLRLFFQPTMAILLGIRIGVADARKEASPFFRRLITSRRKRWRLIGQSFRYAWIPLTVALVLDGVLQYLAFGRIRVTAAVVVGTLLVWLPFTITRGLTNRIWTRTHPREARLRVPGSRPS